MSFCFRGKEGERGAYPLARKIITSTPELFIGISRQLYALEIFGKEPVEVQIML